eukprot:g4345.t1
MKTVTVTPTVKRCSTDDAFRSSVPTLQEKPSLTTQLEITPMRIRLMGVTKKGQLPVGLEKRVLISRQTSCRDFIGELMSISTCRAQRSVRCRLWKCTVPPETDLAMKRLTRRDFTEEVCTYTHCYGDYHADGERNNSDDNNDGSLRCLSDVVDDWTKVNSHKTDQMSLWCPLLIEMQYASSNAIWPTELPLEDDNHVQISAQTVPDDNNHSNSSARFTSSNQTTTSTSTTSKKITSLREALDLAPIPIAKSYLMNNRGQSYKDAGITGEQSVYTYY